MCAARSHHRGLGSFTLIELIMVAALLSLLAAIALPNLLEARVRAQVARVRADLAAMTTALEAYHVDHVHYPLNGVLYQDGRWDHPQTSAGGAAEHKFTPDALTTPVAYLGAIGLDPFMEGTAPPFPEWEGLHGRYFYTNLDWFEELTRPSPPPVIELMRERYGRWILASAGPNARRRDLARNVYYDPTNGTISDGDIVVSPRRRGR